MSSYITVPIETDPELLLLDAYRYLQARIPGWRPNDTNLDTIILAASAQMAAENRDLASKVLDAIFRWFGAKLAEVAPLDATRATVGSTWVMRDNAGYTIQAGTIVGVRTAGDTLVPFRVLADVTVAPGDTSTATGAVTLVAVEAGASGNDLGGSGTTAELVDRVTYVSTITLTGTTAGGADGETDADYLDRLRSRLRLLTPRPILAPDFAVMARDIPPVYRALAIDGYNPTDDTTGNDRTVAVFPIDSSGDAIGTPQKTALDTYLQSFREANFLVYVADPTYTTIDVTYAAVALAGYATSDVAAAVTAAVTAYLSPATWGVPASGEAAWTPAADVRYLEVAQVINNVAGVDYVSSLTIGLSGGAQTAADHTLTGAAPLPQPGTITGTVT